MTEIQINTRHEQYKPVESNKQGLSNNRPAINVSETELNNTITAKDAMSEQAVETETETATKLQEKVTQLNDHMQNLSRNLQFSVDENSGDTVVVIRDSETDELIRQIPSEEVLNARSAADQIKGLLIEAKV